MRRSIYRASLAGLLLLAARAGALTPFNEVARGVSAYVTTFDPSKVVIPPADKGSFAEQTKIHPDGSAELTVHGGKLDFLHFGPGLSQTFAGIAGVGGYVLVGHGAIHAAVTASAVSEPTQYGQGFVEGTNPFNALATSNVAGTIHDVIVPPATSKAPHKGDPTTLSFHLRVDCTRDPGELTRDFPGYTRGTSLILAVQLYDDQGNFLGGGQQQSDEINIYSLPCPFTLDAVVPNLAVLTPIEVQFILGVNAQAVSGMTIGEGGGLVATVDSLNTATMTITNEDGIGLVGLSGTDWSAPATGPTITTTSTTTTTTSSAPPTTLPSCTGYCGDGLVQPDCAEACECPMPFAGQAGVACDAATATPTLAPDCARCVGCEIDLSPCATTTTTTTLPAACVCGDGVWDRFCDVPEECDCSGAAPCTGPAIVPPQQPCAVCTGCTLDFSACPGGFPHPTTTTMIGATTTTTSPTSPVTSTTHPTSTSSTTLPAGPPPLRCAALQGLARTRCELEEALAHPLCGAETVPAKLDHALRAKLGAADTSLGQALSVGGAKDRRLLKRVRHDLAGVKQQSAVAARSKSAKRRISAACAAMLKQLVGAEMAGLTAP